MTDQILKIATRKSPLALWQAEHVKKLLLANNPNLSVELLKISTQGDKILDTPLAKVGGKGLFVKELETCLLNGTADIAVHSMKDVPVDLPQGLHLEIILKREDPQDAFVSNTYACFADLPSGARVGTSSMRRQSQLKAKNPDIVISDLRGNVGTRLGKLDNGDYDAIILASAGLVRLGLGERITEKLAVETCLPAIGQGAIGIETRIEDPKTHQLLTKLNDPNTAICVTAERALNHRLMGGCQVPIGGHAILTDDTVFLRGLVGDPSGQRIIMGDISGTHADAAKIGRELADELLEKGADKILKAVFEA